MKELCIGEYLEFNVIKFEILKNNIYCVKNVTKVKLVLVRFKLINLLFKENINLLINKSPNI